MLSAEEKAVYEWQIWARGFGEAGQARLKGASVLVSRVGGLGGPVAQELAAAGVGRIVLAHAGDLQPSDLNRQILMRHDGLGTPRVAMAKAQLLALNPRLDVVAVPENINEDNARGLVSQVDLVFDCAPMFQERFALNRACVALGKPMIDCAMYELEGQVTTLVPGETPCLACIYPEIPAGWKRQFPVFGAVSCMAGCIGVVEGIKLLSGMAEPALRNVMLYFDLRTMSFRRLPLQRRADCAVCGHLPFKAKPYEPAR